MSQVTEQAYKYIEEIADAAASKALVKFFAALDIDPNDKDALRSLREDLHFLSSQREGADELKKWVKKTGLAAVSAALLGLAYWAWDIFKEGLMIHVPVPPTH